jgi:hypothetical protein
MATVRGYEGGVDEVDVVRAPANLHPEVNKERWYYGLHEYCDLGSCFCQDTPNGLKTILAVHLEAQGRG